MTDYYAHTPNSEGKWHDLKSHLKETANIAESFACHEQYKLIFRLAGFLHDIGKYQQAFQNYLIEGGERGSVPHASWGAGYARLCKLLEASMAIDGHHKGLPDKSAWKSSTEPFKKGDVTSFGGVLQNFFLDTTANKDTFGNTKSLKFDTNEQREIFIRYLFSSLTDADWLSTEKHFDGDKFLSRHAPNIQPAFLMEKLKMEIKKKSKEGEINELRERARAEALQKADSPVGFFSLSLPTGIGKTLTSMAWALKHAERNNLSRIIIVLPFINIIDQTSQILKDIFGDQWVLEHHSGYNEDSIETREKIKKCSSVETRKKLACENWDYPIIVTTTVQFFESFFSNHPSRCRKVHNMAESAVIFDEVQTLPKDVLLPTLQMLRDAQKIMKSSFLFCTATQPAFQKREGFEGIENITPLIDEPSVFHKKTKRVSYDLLNQLNPVDNTQLLKAVKTNEHSVLVIFNTKKNALEFYNSLRAENQWERKYHLSTSMCPVHRKEVIKNIIKDLEEKRKVAVASTQLIEAGVDFDFPVVFRAMAPLEAVIQSAGRCNREGNLGEMGGRVFLFKLQDGGMPDKTYAACAGHAEEWIRMDINQLYDPSAFEKYYAQIIKLYCEPDKRNICHARRQFNLNNA